MRPFGVLYPLLVCISDTTTLFFTKLDAEAVAEGTT